MPARDEDGRFRSPDHGDSELDDPAYYLNRELSWLEFNRRVLTLATDASIPLLERARFLGIFHSNLDEFFMVRVAGLKQQVASGVTRRTADGRTPSEQLGAIAERLHPMIETAQETFHEQLLPLLERQGVRIVSAEELSSADRGALDRYFEDEVFPVLTPLAVDPGHPFPYISNLSLSLAVTVSDRKTGDRRFARVKVPGVLPRFVPVADGQALLPLEELIESRLGRLFPGMDVLEAHAFRVTRNADLDIEEDEAEDLLLAIEKELRRRRFGAVVRLEVEDTMPAWLLQLLAEELEVADEDVYRLPGLLGLGDATELAEIDRPDLHWQRWTPVPHPRLRSGSGGEPADVFAAIRRGDLLVHHPFDSFEHTVEHLITSAAHDPQVLAIKQTLYRTSGDSPIVRSLVRAAEQGKQVVAIVELKARFDEEANITWARELERAGVHVVYGLVGLKTHAKTALVVRRDEDGIRRYCHVGTGNYNPRTANYYTDLGMLTADPAIGADLTDLFNFLTGYARHDSYRKLLVAPVSLRERLTRLIEREVEVHRSGERQGFIRAKLNSLLDTRITRSLYEASQAGVQIDLVVRGICSVRPGVPGVSDRIRVLSIVGRFLEHSRIVQFGPDDVWMGSPDWMPRNLDRRVETLAPIDDPEMAAELRATLDVYLADNCNAWHLEPDGSWRRRIPEEGEPRRDSQRELMLAAAERAPDAVEPPYEPHRVAGEASGPDAESEPVPGLAERVVTAPPDELDLRVWLDPSEQGAGTEAAR
ncbi:RNA degradosome polyphosphate kinase [Egibacter rhizosphaerae]|uniref:Polyphosphate kinase n=1 Tax=Egibacter rhizosphaerae TaxID=1670831 RepID=A0A411YLV8_9ACTN|nr:RNA degradosome polyphosphate kinase [Egibacter rhizosphaerae]